MVCSCAVWCGTAGALTDEPFIACYTWRHSSISSMQRRRRRRRRRREQHLSARFVYTRTGRALTVRLTGHARVGRSGRHWCLASCPSTPVDWASGARVMSRLSSSSSSTATDWQRPANASPIRFERRGKYTTKQMRTCRDLAMSTHRSLGQTSVSSTPLYYRSHTSFRLTLCLVRKHSPLALH